MQYAFLNGSEVNPLELSVPVTGNRGLFYGDGVFETIKIVGGKPLFAEDHFQRLAHGCRLLGMKLPDTERIGNLISGTVHSNSRARLTVWRDSEGYYLPDSDSVSWLLTFQHAGDEDSVYDSREVKLTVYTENYKSSGWLSNIKSLNSLIYVSSARFSALHGADEAVILNSSLRVAESTSSNLFALIGGRWVTPPLSESCLDGVMRKNLWRLMTKNGIDISEHPITQTDLQNAEEVLLTNVIKGIRQVTFIDGRQYKSHSAAYFTGLLNTGLNLSE